MVSTCPNCKRQIEHEDFLFEVVCECGMRFNPFFDAAQGTEADAEPGTGGGTGKTPVTETPDLGDFTESRSAFEDIVKFGETMEETPNPTSETKKASVSPGSTAAPVSVRPPSVVSGEAIEGVLFFAADAPTALAIEAYLTPVSAWAALDSETTNPLGSGFESLSQQAAAAGANALVSLRWAFSPDGARCLLTAIPVRATKIA
jgi:hypothetical protein